MRNQITWPTELGTAGILAPGPWLWLRAVLWAVVLSAGAVGAFLSTQYLGGWLHLPPGSAYYTVLIIPVLSFVAYALVVRAAEHRPAVEVLPHAGMAAELLIGALLGLLMVVAITALLWGLGLYQVQPGHWRQIFASFVFNSYLSGMMEELLFRAILLRILGRAFGPIWGLGLSAALFGLAHLSHGDLLAAASLTVNAGLPMGLAYLVTGRLWLAIGMHTAWDFVEDSLLGVNSRDGLLRSTPVAGRPEFLTGGSFGPDASVLFLLVGAAACFALVAWNRRSGPRRLQGDRAENPTR